MRDQADSLRCYDAINVWTDRPTPLREALEAVSDDWIDGNVCHQTTMDLRDACKQLLSVADAWQWTASMGLVVRQDAAILEECRWWVFDVDDDSVARGRTPLEAIVNARELFEGTSSKQRNQ